MGTPWPISLLGSISRADRRTKADKPLTGSCETVNLRGTDWFVEAEQGIGIIADEAVEKVTKRCQFDRSSWSAGGFFKYATPASRTRSSDA